MTRVILGKLDGSTARRLDGSTARRLDGSSTHLHVFEENHLLFPQAITLEHT